MAYLLNIETATKNCSVSLALDGRTVLCREVADQGYSHAEKLHVFIEEVVKESGIHLSDVKAIAVSEGPGSYTGLRIGVSAAKGLCYALKIPLIAVDTLAVLAEKVKQTDGLVIPMIDARRMEVYSAVFNEKRDKIADVKAEILTEESYSELTETVYFVGGCQEKCKTVLTKDNFVFLPEVVFPSANEMSAISHKKFEKNEFEDVAYFEPLYLKDFMLPKNN